MRVLPKSIFISQPLCSTALLTFKQFDLVSRVHTNEDVFLAKQWSTTTMVFCRFLCRRPTYTLCSTMPDPGLSFLTPIITPLLCITKHPLRLQRCLLSVFKLLLFLRRWDVFIVRLMFSWLRSKHQSLSHDSNGCWTGSEWLLNWFVVVVRLVCNGYWFGSYCLLGWFVKVVASDPILVPFTGVHWMQASFSAYIIPAGLNQHLVYEARHPAIAKPVASCWTFSCIVCESDENCTGSSYSAHHESNTSIFFRVKTCRTCFSEPVIILNSALIVPFRSLKSELKGSQLFEVAAITLTFNVLAVIQTKSIFNAIFDASTVVFVLKFRFSSLFFWNLLCSCKALSGWEC